MHSSIAMVFAAKTNIAGPHEAILLQRHANTAEVLVDSLVEQLVACHQSRGCWLYWYVLNENSGMQYPRTISIIAALRSRV